MVDSGRMGMCFEDETVGFINRLNVECERDKSRMIPELEAQLIRRLALSLNHFQEALEGKS